MPDFDGVLDGDTEGVLDLLGVCDGDFDGVLVADEEPDLEDVPERVSVGEGVSVELREDPADGVPVWLGVLLGVTDDV